MPVSIVIGGQFGSEGKGKVALEIARRSSEPVVAIACRRCSPASRGTGRMATGAFPTRQRPDTERLGHRFVAGRKPSPGSLGRLNRATGCGRRFRHCIVTELPHHAPFAYGCDIRSMHSRPGLRPPTSLGHVTLWRQPMRIEPAIAFVDWNLAVIASGPSAKMRDGPLAERALRHVEALVATHLAQSYDRTPFRVILRLYTGWWHGLTPSRYRRGIESVLERYAVRPRVYRDGRVLFPGGRDGLQTSDRLAGIDIFLTRRMRVHFVDMIRTHDGCTSEKMVDTALVVDLLGLVRRRAANRYLVISDDDDMLPGVIAAKNADSGAQIEILRRSGRVSRHMPHIRQLVHAYPEGSAV